MDAIVGIFSQNVGSISKYVFLFTGLLSVVFYINPTKIYFKLPKNSKFIIAYVCLYLVMMLIETNPSVKIYQFRIGFVMIENIFLLLLGYNIFRFQIINEKFLIFFGMSCGLVSILFNFGIGVQNFVEQTGIRSSAINQGPNAFASLMGLGIICLVSWLFWPRKKRNLLSIIIILLISFSILIALISTGSRGGFIASVLGIVAAFPLRKRNRKYSFYVFLVSVIFIFSITILILQSEVSIARWEDILIAGNFSRGKIFLESWNIFTEKWLLGWGPGNNVLELAKLLPHIRRGTLFLDTHNDLLHIATEMGIIGLFFYFMILWPAVKNAIILRKLGLYAPFSLLLCVFLTGMSITYYRSPTLWILLAYSLSFLENKIGNKYKEF
ncbi:MAG: O-antigen ligase family protein [Anaerolineaceae bacterium]